MFDLHQTSAKMITSPFYTQSSNTFYQWKHLIFSMLFPIFENCYLRITQSI